MNKIFKVVFNKVKGMFVVCSELDNSHSKSRKLKASVTALAAVALMSVVGNAVANTTISIASGNIHNAPENDINEPYYTDGYKNFSGTNSGVFLNYGTLNVNGAIFGIESSSNSVDNGDAIYNTLNGTINFSGTNTFTGNTATKSGGAIYSGSRHENYISGKSRRCYL